MIAEGYRPASWSALSLKELQLIRHFLKDIEQCAHIGPLLKSRAKRYRGTLHVLWRLWSFTTTKCLRTSQEALGRFLRGP